MTPMLFVCVCVQVRADLLSVSLEALSEKTANGQKALALRRESEQLMQKFKRVGFSFVTTPFEGKSPTPMPPFSVPNKLPTKTVSFPS